MLMSEHAFCCISLKFCLLYSHLGRLLKIKDKHTLAVIMGLGGTVNGSWLVIQLKKVSVFRLLRKIRLFFTLVLMTI